MSRFISFGRASFRLWYKQKIGVFIAVAGLVGALAISMLTAMYLFDSLRSDNWLETSDRLYRVTKTTLQDGKPSDFFSGPMTLVALGPLIPESVPHVDAFTRIQTISPTLMYEGATESDKWLTVDEGFADVFPLPMVAGSLAHTLEAPDRLALSWSKAQKYGGLKAVGKTLDAEIQGEIRTIEITAIFDDLPDSTHLKLSAITLLHDRTLPKQAWAANWPNTLTYLTLKKELPNKNIVEEFGSFVDAELPPSLQGRSYNHSLEPVVGLMFHSKQSFGGYLKPALRRDYLYGLGAYSRFAQEAPRAGSVS